MSDSQRHRCRFPRFVAAAEAAVIAASGPLAFPAPDLKDPHAMGLIIAQTLASIRELCQVHGIDPDGLWAIAKFQDQD